MIHVDSLRKFSSLCIVEKDPSSQFYYFFSHFSRVSITAKQSTNTRSKNVIKYFQLMKFSPSANVCGLQAPFKFSCLLLFTRLGSTCSCAHSPGQKTRCGELIQPLSGCLISRLLSLNIFCSAGLLLSLNRTHNLGLRELQVWSIYFLSKFLFLLTPLSLGGFTLCSKLRQYSLEIKLMFLQQALLWVYYHANQTEEQWRKRMEKKTALARQEYHNSHCSADCFL